MMSGDLYRSSGAWRFPDLGDGIQGGIEELAQIFSVDL